MFRLENVVFKNILEIEQLIIPANKITCIVGESGGGKTTFLRLLNKMINCTEGAVYYNDNPLSAINSIELRREVVMLPQVPAIFTGTVRDNLLIGLKFSDKPLLEDEKLVQALNMVHLDKPLEENADRLSGGERQRLALGRVILMEPKVFLLDEPSSALDEGTEKIIIEQLVDYTRQNNKTLIMVTHSKKIALAYADMIVEISNGKLLDRANNSGQVKNLSGQNN